MNRLEAEAKMKRDDYQENTPCVGCLYLVALGAGMAVCPSWTIYLIYSTILGGSYIITRLLHHYMPNQGHNSIEHVHPEEEE